MKCDFNANQEEWKAFADKIIYTGAIDEYFDYKFGELEYRGLRFEIEKHDVENYQGVAAVNYTDRETPYTRIIEHKHFELASSQYLTSPRNIQQIGIEGKRLTIRLIILRTMIYMRNMLNWLKMKLMLFLAEDWANINIMIWIK